MSVPSGELRKIAAGWHHMGLAVVCVMIALWPSEALVKDREIGERPAVLNHLEQQAIGSGQYGLRDLVASGQALFNARFNLLDGQGRPESTGTGAPRAPGQPAFIRTSAPESNSCAGCHAQPRSGGAGDFVANVFVLAQALDPVTDSVDGTFSNERNTLGMFGSGAIEMLAREMSVDLIAIREAAREKAQKANAAVTQPLLSKGVSFGSITVLPDGRVDPGGIEGEEAVGVGDPVREAGVGVGVPRSRAPRHLGHGEPH